MLTTGKPCAIHKFTPNGDILPYVQSSSYTQREYESLHVWKKDFLSLIRSLKGKVGIVIISIKVNSHAIFV